MIGIIFWFCVLVILYTYAGYPLLITIMARLRPSPRYPEAELPDVTLLIAAYNEEKIIQKKLENSLKISYPQQKLQILVVADGSDDRTPDIVKSFAAKGVELCYQPQRQGKTAAINRAIKHARGEIVIFSDANNMYDVQTLHELVKPFSKPSVGAVSGSKSILKGDGALGESEGLYWKFESFIKKQETRLGTCTGVAGEILAIRRTLFEPPPGNVINDDFAIAMLLIKRGYQIAYAPKARSYERVSLTAKDEIVRRTRIVAGRYQAMFMAPRLLTLRRPLVLWQVISHKFLRPLVPFAMAGALFANLAALFFTPTSKPAIVYLSPPFHWVFLGLQFFFYTTAVIGNTQKKNSRLGKILYLPTFLVNSNLAAVAGLIRFLTGKQTQLWKRVRRQDET